MPGFDAASARRIAEQVRRNERTPRTRIKDPRGPALIPFNKCGITTTTLTARSSKTPGSGMVQPYTFNGTVFVSHGSPIKVRNWTGSVIGSNLWIQYNSIDGFLFFNGNDCSGVAP